MDRVEVDYTAMKKKKWKSAQELMAELNSNPDFVRRTTDKEQRRNEREQHYRAMERSILDELGARGIDAPSIADAVKKYSPLPDEVVNVFLTGVETTADLKVLETLIRGLGAAAHPFDGRPLAKCYDSCNDENLRWVIANTIALARPHSISDWLQDALRRDPGLGKTIRELGIDK
jgi:hypothetical protein